MLATQDQGVNFQTYADGGLGWGRIGMMPAPGQYTFESPQLARYEGGQHFLSHQVSGPLRPALLCLCNIGPAIYLASLRWSAVAVCEGAQTTLRVTCSLQLMPHQRHSLEWQP